MMQEDVNIAELVITLLLVGVLAAIALFDVRQWRIPDALNALVFGLAVAAALLLDRVTIAWALVSSVSMLMLALVIRDLFRRVRGHHGLGLGDVKFAAAAAALIGLEWMPVMILLASGSALALVAINRFAGNPLALADRIYFGPFLSVALLALWIAPYLGSG